MSSRSALAWTLLRAEGPRAVLDRLSDRRADALRAASFRTVEPADLVPAGAPGTAIVNLLSIPPQRRRGGLPLQLLARLEHEARVRPVALLYLDPAGGAGTWKLEWRYGGERRVARFAGPGPRLGALEDVAFEAAARAATQALGAQAVHAEDPGALPLASLENLRVGGLRLILSAHDFGLFCLRPHLLEQPFRRFCAYSVDPARCAACLSHGFEGGPGFQEERRAVAARLIEGAAAVVFASDFLRRRFADLFPRSAHRAEVIEPAIELPSLRDPDDGARTRPHALQHLAYAGSVLPHKGSAVFEALLALPGVSTRRRFTVYGGGDPATLRRLRQRPAVAVRGYYRTGSLAGHLRRDRVGLVLLLSIVPEAHGLVLDECIAAGVPVVAFDHGALGERVGWLGAGLVVDPAAGAAGVAAAIDRAASAPGLDAPGSAAIGALPTPVGAAAAHLALYARLGLH